MAWEQVETRVPTSIGTINLGLVNSNGSSEYQYNVTVLDQNGNSMGPVDGSLDVILAARYITAADGILQAVRDKAIADLLPG